MDPPFSHNPSLRGPLETCLDAAIALTSAQKGNIQLLDEVTETFKIFVHRGFDAAFLNYFESVSAESISACGAALRAGERIVVEDVEDSEVFRGTPALQVLLHANVRAVQSTPLVSRSGRIVGLLSTHFERPHRLSSTESQVLDLLARQATDLLERFAAETTLKESEERLRALAIELDARVRERTSELSESVARTQYQAELLDAANDAIFVRDRQARINYWNKGAERLYGWTKEEAIGKTTRELLKTEFPAPVEQIMQETKGGGWEGELVHSTRDGGRLTVASRWTPLKDDRGETIGWLTINTDITKHKQAEKSVRQLAAHLLKSQDEERRRIARELHDSTGQTLAALAINLDQVAAANVDEDQAGLLNTSAQLIQEITQEIRTISYLLHPPLLDEIGLASALVWFVEGFEKRSGIKTTLDLAEDFGRLSQEAEIALYRVVQESLTNVHRHSGSRTATVRLQRSAGEVKLEVVDEGGGMEMPNPVDSSDQPSMGVGLRGMRERIAQLGGDLQVASGEKGTLVSAVLPIAMHSSSSSAAAGQEIA